MNRKYLLIGILFGLAVLTFSTCKEDSKSPSEPVNQEPVESPVIEELNEDVKNIKTAFESGSFDQVKTQITGGALEKYGEDLKQVQEKYSDFAKALESKKLKAYSTFYAEYEIEIDGIKYTVAFAKETESSNWKVVRM